MLKGNPNQMAYCLQLVQDKVSNTATDGPASMAPPVVAGANPYQAVAPMYQGYAGVRFSLPNPPRLGWGNGKGKWGLPFVSCSY